MIGSTGSLIRATRTKPPPSLSPPSRPAAGGASQRIQRLSSLQRLDHLFCGRDVGVVGTAALGQRLANQGLLTFPKRQRSTIHALPVAQSRPLTGLLPPLHIPDRLPLTRASYLRHRAQSPSRSMPAQSPRLHSPPSNYPPGAGSTRPAKIGNRLPTRITRAAYGPHRETARPPSYFAMIACDPSK